MMDLNRESRRELLKKIQEADFYALDLQLYLNTHPNCTRALSLYSKTIAEAKKLREEFEKKYGPLTAGASSPTTPWQWINSPWTWENERS